MRLTESQTYEISFIFSPAAGSGFLSGWNCLASFWYAYKNLKYKILIFDY